MTAAAVGELLDAWRAAAGPGDGVVARFPGVVAVVGRDRDPAELARLLGLCREVSGAGRGRVLARRLVAALADLDDPGDLGVVAATDDALAVLLCGAATLVRPDAEPLCGRSAATWVDRLLPWPDGPFRLTLDPGEAAVGAADPLLDLRAGAVPGGSVVLAPPSAGAVRAPAAGAGAAAGPPTAEPVPAGPVPAAEPSTAPVRAVALPGPPPAEPAPTPYGGLPLPVGGPTPVAAPDRPAVLVPPRRTEPIAGVAPDGPARAPLPPSGDTATAVVEPTRPPPDGVLVDGVLCARSHLNDPRSRACGVCGIRMPDRSGALVTGVRPPLGLLVFDDGASFALDCDYLLGRLPDSDDRVRSGAMRPLVVVDTRGLVSRVHLELVLRGWDVYVTDVGSANGTSVAVPDAPGWTPLVPGRPRWLPPGARVAIGDRTFVVESSTARL